MYSAFRYCRVSLCVCRRGIYIMIKKKKKKKKKKKIF